MWNVQPQDLIDEVVNREGCISSGTVEFAFPFNVGSSTWNNKVNSHDTSQNTISTIDSACSLNGVCATFSNVV